MYLKIQGLVLRRTEYNDHDVLLTILSREHGKITAKARGLKRKNSPLTAQCQLLAFAEFTLFEYRGMYTINEAHSIELFTALRRDLTKLSLGTYFAQVSELISGVSHRQMTLLWVILRIIREPKLKTVRFLPQRRIAYLKAAE